MKTTILGLLLIVLSPICSYGQNESASKSTSDFNTTYTGSISRNGLWVPAYSKDKSIEGSPYLFPNWNGMYSVVNTKGNKFKVLNLNYNIEAKTIETKVSKDYLFQ